MKYRRILPLILFALALLPGIAPAVQAEEAPPAPDARKAPPEPKPIDLVICLDTSGSMEGLIDAARKKLWSVVSELATAKPQPDLRVALLTYGSPGNDATGHVIVQADLTRDLDLISEKLFALRTRGGEEFVGRVVHHALTNLSWVKTDALRMVFVAGNESADQDRVKPFRDQAKVATGMKVVVNAIYCGGADDPDAVGYRELAALASGRFANIDHNHGTVAIATPFDKELATLSSEINKTYVAYGLASGEARRRQVAQDENAASAGAPAAAERAQAKAGRLYRNSQWDLVDKMEEQDFDLAAIPEDQLPDELKKLEPKARLAYLQAKKAERAAIQAKVKDLSAKRQAFIQAEMAKQQLDDTQALDRALKDAVREQATANGFHFAN